MAFFKVVSQIGTFKVNLQLGTETAGCPHCEVPVLKKPEKATWWSKILFLHLTAKGLDEVLIPRIESASSSDSDTSQNSELSPKEKEDRAKVMLLMEALISPGISDLIIDMGYDNDNNTDPKVLYDYLGQLNDPRNVPAKSFCKRLRGRIFSLKASRK